jgi:predicted helicase
MSKGSFVEHSFEPISKPQDLAKHMARLAHRMQDAIIDAFRQKEISDYLWDLYSSLQEALLPDLKESEFADMLAQMMAYGLFAARCNHTQKSTFHREDVAKEIPCTNPFLRKLFSTIADPKLDDEPFMGFVDELVQILALTDMEAVLADFGKRTRQTDPIVHFYEMFLTQYDPKLREMRGVYYTPEPVVSYIVRSVDYLLCKHFDCPDGLADTTTITYSCIENDGEEHEARTPRVLILDPATGTGTFLYYVIAHIRESYRQKDNIGIWSGYVREHLLSRLFGFELLLVPYVMAHLKLGMQLAAIDLPKAERATWAYDFSTNECLQIYLTNALEDAYKHSGVMFGCSISDEANEATKVMQSYPVMVILGNPPYAGHSANKGQWINDLLRGKDSQTDKSTGNYFEVDGQPLGEHNPKYLHDDYVKFIRFAQWRIEKTGYGILAFVTNHSYLDNPTFRGMRQSLMQSFDEIYVLDLHGNSRKKEHTPEGLVDENVFDIQQGVAIGLFVKKRNNTSNNTSQMATVHHAHLWGLREVYDTTGQLVSGKYHWLAGHDSASTEWTTLTPQSPFYLFVPQNISLQAEYGQGWNINDIMPINSTGVKTHRDHFVLDFGLSLLYKRISDFKNTSISDEEIAKIYKLNDTRDWKLSQRRRSLQSDIDWENYFTKCLYRPFDTRIYYHHNDVVELPRNEVMQHLLLGTNKALLWIRPLSPSYEFSVFAGTYIPHQCAVGNKMAGAGASYVAPLYIYPNNNHKGLFDLDTPTDVPGGRRSNLSPAFIKDFSTKLKMRFIPDGKGDLQQTFGPEDIFNYMYAIFHSPTYRERYAEFLKIDFPRLPLTSNANLFRDLCKLGDRLVELHLMEQFGEITTKYPVSGDNVVEKIDYTQPANAPEQGRVWINKTQYIEGVPPEVWSFRIGGYQICQQWLKDRKGRKLSLNDIMHYQRIVAALAETITLMGTCFFP